ncbi:YfdX family protein [Methylomarinum sp. Ch1-1]|uniref:YfdX family protein n=1 Tax=Methylomarinum roseum TaxID=3067653 RepID=A0AAU7NYH1_9GAMM|nr:YfdX family protein [Methylomarinum sp. Ch1-1]MDP4521906.1 YfdX family protein [Methylomarinum sp. Ch1-1]
MSRNETSKNKTTAALLLAFATAFGMAQEVVAAADRSSSSSASKSDQQSEATKQTLLKEKQRKVEHEAQEVIQETRNALLAFQKQDSAKAMALLQEVSGKLDILLARHPDLKLIPANVEADVYDLDSDPEQVAKMVDTADDLLDDDKVQDARYILSALVSEIRISTTSIPLGIFPDAIKEAAALGDQGKTDEAAEALSATLSMLVKTTDIIPLPVLRAEALLSEAAQLEHQNDLSQEQSRSEVLKVTDAAKQQLKLAQALGYGDKEDYETLYDSIDGIKDVIHSEKSAETWNRIKQSLKDFKNKMMHSKK